MKTASKIMLIALFVSLPLMAFAQPGPHGMMGKMCGQLNLTDEQQSQIQTLALNHQKEMMMLNDQLRSLRTQMKVLLTQDNPSSGEVKKLAGQIGSTTEKIALAKANHKIEVRKLLTAEQKVKFDMMTLHGNKRMGNRGWMDKPSPPNAPNAPGCRGPMGCGMGHGSMDKKAR